MLARLLRQIYFDLQVEYSRIEYNIDQYIKRQRKSAVDAEVSGYYNRGNLRRELIKDDMTWKVFIKNLKIMDIPKFRIILELHHRYRDVSYHKVDIDISTDDLFKGETQASMEEE